MCYWVGTKKVIKAMEKTFNLDPNDEIAKIFHEVFIANNALPFKEYYVAIGKGKPTLTTLFKEQGNLHYHNMQWTLPYSYFDKKTSSTITRELLNSTAERVFFQHKNLIFKQRCLVPIDGYYEFRHFNGDTYPYFIYPTNNELFYAGGIWEKQINQETGEISETFSIITVPPNPLVTNIHNNPKAPNGPRMLLLIPQNKALSYLDENLNMNQIKDFLKPFDQSAMQAHTVVRFLKKENYVYVNTPKVQEYFDYPELAA
jgi:putative SOS response-associated peptidase YedK